VDEGMLKADTEGRMLGRQGRKRQRRWFLDREEEREDIQ
jgi:hypothetical protein